MLTIATAASRCGVTADAIRFYERKGLLEPARKTAARYRLYDEDSLRRIRFIKQAQACGFSLGEIRELLALRRNERGCCRDVRKAAIEKKLEVEHRIRALRAISEALSALIASCDDDSRPVEDCPILGALGAGGDGTRQASR